MIDLKKFRKENKIRQSELCNVLEITQPYLSAIENGRRPLNEDKLAKLYNHYGNILLNYKETLRPIVLEKRGSTNFGNLSGNVIAANESVVKDVNMTYGAEQAEQTTKKYDATPIQDINVIMVPLVSQYAQAGYLCGFADTEYVETLPTVPFIPDHEAKGKYIAFEVKGDSMDDNTPDSLLEGDVLICRNITSNLWQYKLHFKKWDFVIVHRTEGILVKRIVDHDEGTGMIKIHSLNPLYEDREMNLRDVSQIFNVIQSTRSRKR